MFCDKFCQNCILELHDDPLTIAVLSPFIDKYFGTSVLVLFQTKLKSDEFGLLKSVRNTRLHLTSFFYPFTSVDVSAIVRWTIDRTTINVLKNPCICREGY